MGPAHLQLLGSAAGPAGTTDYTFRFTHPFDLPPDLEPPATAAKRLDLFIFDVNLAAVAEGTDRFFGGAVTLNAGAMPNCTGLRSLSPLLDPATFGAVQATVFPYRLLSNYSAANPRGNYNPVNAWGDHWLDPPSGYDVIPHGGQATATVRLSNSLPTPLPLVVIAKYMDPRGGTDGPTRRRNRLPDPGDPAALRYYCPEACGDLQAILPEVRGNVADTDPTQEASVVAKVLDWDAAAVKADPWPDPQDPLKISEVSRPTAAEASFPTLQAAGPFPATAYGASYGAAQEWVDITFQITNPDGQVEVPPGGGTVQGLVRVRDTQDTTPPHPTLLDEALFPRPLPPGAEPSTRYQLVTVPIVKLATPPVITSVSPLAADALRPVTFSASAQGGAVTDWSWSFGAGCTPSTSTDAAPAVRTAGAGTYNCSVTATGPGGEHTFPFTLEVSQKLFPFDLVVFTSGGTFPRRWYGLSEWSEPAIRTWLQTRINPIHAGSGVGIDIARTTLRVVERPELFNLDTEDELWTLVDLFEATDPSVLSMHVVNDCTVFGFQGAMIDLDCDFGNDNRGCFVTSHTTSIQVLHVAHELGHMMNLPHICTSTCDSERWNNIMSYGGGTALSASITRSATAGCGVYQPATMNQYQVSNDWVHGNF
ncbi:MAG TPA: hypothetical protein VEI97_02200 [bacterium]|nr:hypothetical protein [bacterium]